MKFEKNQIEFTNSVLWFAMDAMWMYSWVKAAYILSVPTVLTGLWMIFKSSDFDAKLIDLACFFWILMNITWLCAEELKIQELVVASKFSFILGMISMSLAFIISSDSKKLILLFRRFKFRKQNEIYSPHK